jgi:hypothetical protein
MWMKFDKQVRGRKEKKKGKKRKKTPWELSQQSWYILMAALGHQVGAT